jgi:hypothetical protein
MLRYHVLNDSQDLARVLISIGCKANEKSDNYYESFFGAGLDMLSRLQMHGDIVSTLITEDCVMRALDYAKQFNVIGLKYKALMENVEAARSKGDDIKASILTKRLSKLREVS